MDTTQVKLRFESMQDLWRFAQRIRATNIEINTREQTLICHCSPEEAELAKERYGAETFCHPKTNA